MKPTKENFVEHSVFAFYGINAEQPNVEAIYRQFLSWFEQLGCKPDLMGTDLQKGYSGFRSAERRLFRHGFSSVRAIDIVTLAPGAEHEGKGRDMTLVYSGINPGIKDSVELVIETRVSIVPLRSPCFLKMAQEALDLIQPQYAIGFTRVFGLGPSYYALAIIYNAPIGGTEQEERETDRIGEWDDGLKYMVYLRGQIRDVYPLSLLNSSQLEAKMGNQTFAQWINSDKKRGKLTPWPHGLTLWEVEDDAIGKLRKHLLDACIMFDYQRDIEAKLIAAEEAEGRGGPLTGEESVVRVMEAYGYDDPETFGVLKVEEKGEVRELPSEEIKKIQKKGKGKKN